MSSGSWTPFAFAGWSILAASAQFGADAARLRWARRFARAVGLPAAMSGALVATYTGALLSATSTLQFDRVLKREGLDAPLAQSALQLLYRLSATDLGKGSADRPRDAFHFAGR